MSLGSSDPLDETHLAKLAALAERVEPMFVSEHLCWSSIGGRHANDLLPLPFTEEALSHVAARVARVQERLKRAILVENVSSYFAFGESTLPEAHFVAEVARRAGCKLLLDVNNVFVNARNHGFDAYEYLESIDVATEEPFDMTWMFAAYVNENHPLIDPILREALDTGIVNAFDGYQAGDEDDVYAQVFAVWNVIQRRGF